MSKIVKIFKKNCQNTGQVMFPHHSDQMSQRSQVSRFTMWCCLVVPDQPSKGQGHLLTIELLSTEKYGSQENLMGQGIWFDIMIGCSVREQYVIISSHSSTRALLAGIFLELIKIRIPYISMQGKSLDIYIYFQYLSLLQTFITSGQYSYWHWHWLESQSQNIFQDFETSAYFQNSKQ